jgi:hypothetical protein
MLGNWGAVGNSESDIALDEVNSYDSNLLHETLLGVDERYADYKKNILFQEMIRRMWPELLQWPINPPYTLRGRVLSSLDKVGVLGALKEMKYQTEYAISRWTIKRSS